MRILDNINTPDDVKKLSPEKLPLLAQELRDEIISVVSKNGGHLSPSLGTVELTIALLRTFSPPADKIVWDVGHQAYPWKIMTGRREQFKTLRQIDGLSGFLKPSESQYDVSVTGHAGAALSEAIGLAVARDLTKHRDRSAHVVAVVGDGCMTNGISLEALNNIIEAKSKVIVVLNDNKCSISHNTGALSRQLGKMLGNLHYNRIKRAAESAGHRLHMTFLRGIYHRLEQAVKSLWLKNAFYEEFGIRYIGPIDGHDFEALDNALRSAAEYDRPVLLHIATVKGKGFHPAETAPGAWHGVGPFDPAPHHGLYPPASNPGYSDAFGDELVKLAECDERIVGITAAMQSGTGMDRFASRFPDRFFDVGICEEHAAVFAAGLAAGGLRPVLALYSTFLQRAIDCVMHDICIGSVPVTICIDRAGCVGRDGPTHHGLYDIPLLRALPNLAILQPRSSRELRAMMRWATQSGKPAAIRYPKEAAESGCDGTPIQPIEPGRAEIVHSATGDKPIWIWALGDLVETAKETASLLDEQGIDAGVVNARFIKPIDTNLLRRQAANARLIVTMENGALRGGFGSAIREELSDTGTKVHSFGWPDEFIPHGSIAELRKRYGLTAVQMGKAIAALLQKNSERNQCPANGADGGMH